MKDIGERELRNLAAAIIFDAIKNIERKGICISSSRRPDKDLKWLSDPHSNFPMWCEILGIEPDLFRQRYPLQLADTFKHFKRIQKTTRRRRR